MNSSDDGSDEVARLRAFLEAERADFASQLAEGAEELVRHREAAESERQRYLAAVEHIAGLNHTIEQRDGQIVELDDRLRRQRERVEQLQARVAELGDRLRRRRERLEQLQARVTELSGELDTYTGSRVARAVVRLRGTRSPRGGA